MSYNTPLRMTNNQSFKGKEKIQSSSRCLSTTKKTPVVKTSNRRPFLSQMKKENEKIEGIKIKRGWKYKKEYYIRLNSAFLVRDPSYINFLYFILFYYEPSDILLEYLLDDLESIKKLQIEETDALQKIKYEYLHFQIFQVIINLTCLMQQDENPVNNGGFYLAPAFFPYGEDINHEPEPPGIITRLISSSCLSIESELLFMILFFIGVNPRNKSETPIKWIGPIETLVTWLYACYFLNILFVPDELHKKPEGGKNKKVRPIFPTLIKNHFSNLKKLSDAAIFINCDNIFCCFSDIRNQNNFTFNVSSESKFTHLIRNSLSSMRQSRIKNIISVYNCIPK